MAAVQLEFKNKILLKKTIEYVSCLVMVELIPGVNYALAAYAK